MRPRLLLYITAETNRTRNVVAATLAWAASAADWYFEVYYDGYRLGEHYGGGDPDALPPGYSNGGTMVGAHHHERLYLLFHRFETLVVTDGPVAFESALANVQVERLRVSGALDTYTQVFAALALQLPHDAIIVDALPRHDLHDVDAYCYPEIVGRQALAFEASTVDADVLSALGREHMHVHLLWASSNMLQQLSTLNAQIATTITLTTLDDVQPMDTYATLTERMARRWLTSFTGGWVLADPLTVAAWLPEAVRERRLAIYSKPQHDIIVRLASELSASTSPVLGRQYEDSDFFELSSLGVAFQLIDPGRPPFPVLKHGEYTWNTVDASQGNGAVPEQSCEPDDEQLSMWARERRVLSSVIFWSGMIRELENLPRVVDLVALTGMRGGVALTVPALHYQPETAIEQLFVPFARGGVYPHLEVLLASCGTGASIESRMPEGRLAGHLGEAFAELHRMGLPRAYWPTGWWTTMDVDMLPIAQPRLPITLQAQFQTPLVRVRYHQPRQTASRSMTSSTTAPMSTEHDLGRDAQPGLKRRMGDWARNHGLREALAPYRPFEFFAPGPLRQDMVATAHDVGLGYMFSKAHFNAGPRVLYRDDAFVALNYTVGQWDGWTPFETINDMRDLRRAERHLLATRRPGWLVGTLDTCLWAFTGPIWQRGKELHAIAEFFARGGDSRRLINVTPRVVARYADLLAKEGYLTPV